MQWYLWFEFFSFCSLSIMSIGTWKMHPIQLLNGQETPWNAKVHGNVPYKLLNSNCMGTFFSLHNMWFFCKMLTEKTCWNNIVGSAIINDHHISRRHEKLKWKPPKISVGPIIFLASIIQSKYLLHIRSSFLSPYKSQIYC